MWFAILGPLLVHDGETSVDVAKGRQRALLAALIMHTGGAVSADALVEVAWDGSPPPGADVTLRSHVLRLRRALGPRAGARLVTRHPGYLLQARDDEVDLLRFRGLCRNGGTALREKAWERADRLLGEALSLWRGPPLADILSEQLLREEGPGLEELRLQAEEWRTDAGLHLGRHDELIPGLRYLVAQHPLRERFHGQLMLALYRCGRQAEALAAYQRARGILVGELGTEPGPELQKLHQNILTADPALTLADAPSPQVTSAQLAVPRELPATVRHFTGRSDELAALTRMLEGAPSTMMISAIGGTAGVGKTALAVYWGEQVADRFPDGQLYVNLRGYDPAQPMAATDALAAFLRSLGVPGRDIPPEADERAARYRSLLVGKQMLVILDNARSAEQVRPLLPGSSACTVLVTSRDALAGLVARDGATRLDLDVLSRQEAIALLRALIGARTDAEPEAAAELADQCCRLPLALRVAGELAASRPDVPLAELVRELADLRTRLDLLTAGEDPRTKVGTVFSWSYRHLDFEDARAFRLLGLHPGPDVEPYATAALTGTTVEQARQMLDVLARAHLIQTASACRYRMHDLLRGYACGLAATMDGDQDHPAALTRLFDHYLYTAAVAMETLYPGEQHRRLWILPPASPAPPVTGNATARAWLDAERATLVAVTAHSAAYGWPDHAIRLADVLFRYLDIGGYFSEAITVHGHARRAASQIGDHAAEASALNSLGLANLAQGSYQQASRLHREALSLARGTRDNAEQARAIGNLGIADYQQGRYQSAARYLRRALVLYRQLGDKVGEGRQLQNLGVIEERQGRYDEATCRYQEVLALSREIGDRIGELRGLANLGCAQVGLGQYQQATECLHQSLALAREIGDRSSAAHALSYLGAAEKQLARYQESIAHYTQALAMFRQFSAPIGEVETLNGLGEVLLAAGNHSDACAQHATALDLAIQTGDKYQQARAHNGLGHAYDASGDPGQARDHWQVALDLYAEIGAPEVSQIRAQLVTTDFQDRQ
jgi:DNA-binding SARP family transcriptional activator/tetratricopeptide (TPR) repeat protein